MERFFTWALRKISCTSELMPGAEGVLMMQVAPLQGVAFNNLLCSKLPLTPEATSTTARAVPSNATLTHASPLLVV